MIVIKSVFNYFQPSLLLPVGFSDVCVLVKGCNVNKLIRSFILSHLLRQADRDTF